MKKDSLLKKSVDEQLVFWKEIRKDLLKELKRQKERKSMSTVRKIELALCQIRKIRLELKTLNKHRAVFEPL